MANFIKFPTTTENSPITKRKKVLAAVAQEMLTSEDDDDHIRDGMEVCDIIENYNDEHENATSSASAIYTLGKTIRTTLLEINEIREQNRERRHKELLEVLTKMMQHDNNSTTTSTTKCKISQNQPLTKEPLKSPEIKEHLVADELEQHLTEDYIVEELNSDADEFFSIKPLDNSTTNSINIASQPLTTPLIIKPLIQENREVPSIKKEKDRRGELQKMRAQLLEMQRKKMEDRERKKRELLQI